MGPNDYLQVSESNLAQWQQVTKLVLKNSGVWGVIDGTIPKTIQENGADVPNPDWIDKDTDAQLVILNAAHNYFRVVDGKEDSQSKIAKSF